MMYWVLLLLVAMLAVTVPSLGVEVDVNADGSLDENVGASSNGGRSVQFVSGYEGVMELFWIGAESAGAKESPVLITEIFNSIPANVNTFDGHVFYASSRETGIRADPRKIVITPSKSLYFFEPDAATRSAQADSVAKEKEEEEDGITDNEDEEGTAGDNEVDTMNRDPNVNDGLHPAVTKLHSGTTAMSAKFRSLVSAVDYYYDDGREGIYQGRLKLGQESTTNTYEGHTFYFTRAGDKSKVLERFRIHKDRVLYVVQDPDDPAPAHLLEQTNRELRFMKEYKERTGIHWRHYYGPKGPRSPPELFMWDAKQIGQVHRVTTEHGYWKGDCEEEMDADGSDGGLLSFFTGSAAAKTKTRPCKTPEPLNLTLEVISQAPRAFVIQDFLSDYEADKIIELSKNQLGISTVGNDDGGGARTDATRTSMNTWLGRKSSIEMETLFRRAADVLNIDEGLLYTNKNAEDLQVVHYENGQKYDSHHDWGVSGYPESRFITLLLYLTDQPHKNAGGETSFPKADGGRGIKVHPGKGSAVLFYNLLEDGNGDDLALHAALPVKDGHEKFLANWWVWTPRRR